MASTPMTPFYSDPWLTVWQGDCREAMAAMEPESVHCVVTSPPYWGLRDYGTATWEGGDPACDHLARTGRGTQHLDELGARLGTGGGHKASSETAANSPYRDSCGKCGARRVDGQLGLEPTPEEYVANMVAVFREVRRVLRADGTVWLNLGDSYTSGGRKTRDPGKSKIHPALENWSAGRADNPTGLKDKDLVGIPWRVAFALQADGWYLRSDIIWSKPNPMPESVTDRPTKSHEYLFLLSTSARYYFDADAVREDRPANELAREARGYRNVDANPTPGLPPGASPHTGLHRAAWPGRERNVGGRDDGFTRMPGGEAEWAENGRSGRNIRSVWTIATQPYPGAHFATFPQKLVEPCVKAGCPEGGTVLDPFAGTGTVGIVAQRLSRRAVLIDLSLDYLGQLMDRNRDIPMGLVG